MCLAFFFLWYRISISTRQTHWHFGGARNSHTFVRRWHSRLRFVDLTTWNMRAGTLLHSLEVHHAIWRKKWRVGRLFKCWSRFYHLGENHLDIRSVAKRVSMSSESAEFNYPIFPSASTPLIRTHHDEWSRSELKQNKKLYTFNTANSWKLNSPFRWWAHQKFV